MSNLSASLEDAVTKSINLTDSFLFGNRIAFEDNLRGILYLTNIISDVIEQNYSINNTTNLNKHVIGLNSLSISYSKDIYNDSLEDSEFYIRFIIGGFGCFFNIINVLFFFFTSVSSFLLNKI